MRLLAVVFAFSSLSAVAATCPNLAGTYSACRSTTGNASGSTDVVVTQKVEKGVTIYSVTSTDDESQERDTMDFVADGKTYTSTENDPQVGKITTAVTFTCSDVKIIGTTVMTLQGQEIVNVEQQYQKKGNVMEIDMFGQIFGGEFKDTLICE